MKKPKFELITMHVVIYKDMRTFTEFLESMVEPHMIPFQNLIMTKSEIIAAIENITRGYGAMTEGPIEVVYFPRRKKYQLINGYHRCVEAMMANQPGIIGKIDTSYDLKGWNFPKQSDNFKYDPHSRYHGMEAFVEPYLLRRLG